MNRRSVMQFLGLAPVAATVAPPIAPIEGSSISGWRPTAASAISPRGQWKAIKEEIDSARKTRRKLLEKGHANESYQLGNAHNERAYARLGSLRSISPAYKQLMRERTETASRFEINLANIDEHIAYLIDQYWSKL